MKYLRKILAVKRTYRIRNDTVRNQLEIAPILKTIAERTLKWLGHVERMTDRSKSYGTPRRRGKQKKKA